MNGKNAVKQVMKQEGESAYTLGKKLGYSTRSGVTERVRGKQDMRVDTFAKFMKAMGYEIVVRKIGSTEEIQIDGNETTESEGEEDNE